MSKGYAGVICEAESRVNGVLRGGEYNSMTKVFTFHAGTMKIETKEFSEMKRLKIKMAYGGTEWTEEDSYT